MDGLRVWNQDELPKATNDLVQAKEDISTWGYCLLKNAIPEPLLSQCQSRLIEQAAAEKALGIAFEDGGPNQQWGDFTDATGKVRASAFQEKNGGVNQRVWMLVNKGWAFRKVLELDQLNEMVSHVLGDRFILHSYTANIARPGGVEMPLHIDQWWAPEPTYRGRNYLPVGSFSRDRFNLGLSNVPPSSMLAPPAVSNVLIMVDGMTKRNGGTQIVPGSHLAGRHPDKILDARVKKISAEGPPGSAIITDGRIWHGTGANNSSSERKAILITYSGPQFRPQENYTVGTRKEVLANASDRLRELLGLKVWCGYGRTGDPTVDYINPNDPLTGELIPE